MELTAENYYSPEANAEYMSVSQFKSFAGTDGKLACEAEASYHLHRRRQALMAGVSDNYYYVNGIRHDCETSSMTMELELAKTETVKENQTESKKEYKVGDIVNFHGGTHYVSSYSGSKGYNARAGKAKITIANGSGKAHPWHLIHTDSSSNVYGWVDDGTFD